MMKEEKEARIEELRLRFQELSRQLERIRRKWFEAHDQRDVELEARLVHEETDLFNEVSKVITEFTSLVHHGPQTR